MAIVYTEPFVRPAVLQHLTAYLNGQVELSSFVDWFLPWSLEQRHEPTSLEARLEVLVSEQTSGHGDEQALREALATALLDAMPVSFTVRATPLTPSAAGSESVAVSW